jgi:hypothetical protein
MLSTPRGLDLIPPGENIRIERVKEPPVPFYREMYNALGGKWHGRERNVYFLSWIIQKAWELKPKRLWLHTCALDHQRVLQLCNKSGFIQDKTEGKIQTVPIDEMHNF